MFKSSNEKKTKCFGSKCWRKSQTTNLRPAFFARCKPSNIMNVLAFQTNRAENYNAV